MWFLSHIEFSPKCDSFTTNSQYLLKFCDSATKLRYLDVNFWLQSSATINYTNAAFNLDNVL